MIQPLSVIALIWAPILFYFLVVVPLRLRAVRRRAARRAKTCKTS